MMHYPTMTPLDRLRLNRGAAHLHGPGPRAVAEALATLAQRIGGAPALLAILAEYEALPPSKARTNHPGRPVAEPSPRSVCRGNRPKPDPAL